MTGDNNCEHFANYCVHNRLESFQSDVIKKGADAILSYFEMQEVNLNYPGHEQLLDTFNEIREQFNLERKNETLNRMIEQKLNK